MPHIRVHAVEKETVRELSRTLIPDLARILSSPEDNFTLEWMASEFFGGGQSVPAYPFVEVLWFPRPPELQDQTANLITDRVRSLTKATDVVVVFRVLEKRDYYENGAHF